MSSPTGGALVKLSVFLKMGKTDGALFLEKINDIVAKLAERKEEKKDSEEYRKLMVDVLPNLLTHLKQLTSEREGVERGIVHLISHLVSAVGPQDSKNIHPMLSNLFASCLVYMSNNIWNSERGIINQMCEYILPMTLLHWGLHSKRPLSYLPTTTVLHTVLDSVEEESNQVKVVDTLMWLKRDVCSDVLAVIGMGTTRARQRAVKLLVRYWLAPLKEYNVPHYSPSLEWAPPTCVLCHGDDNDVISPAAVVCLDVQCATRNLRRTVSGPSLFMYLCENCDQKIHGDQCDHTTLTFPQPLRDLKENCEFQRQCVGEDEVNQAVVTCYHPTCTTIQRGQPVRMCQACHEQHHGGLQDDKHIYQVGPLNPWHSGLKRMYMNEVYAAKSLLQAVSKLLETLPEVKVSNSKLHKVSSNFIDREYHFSYSKEALFVLGHFCTPTKHVTSEGRKYWLTRYVAYSLKWLLKVYQMVQDLSPEDPHFPHQHLYKDKLWKDIIKWMIPWLQSVYKLSPQIFVNCLIPDLAPGAQVESFHSEMDQFKHTLQLLHVLNWGKLRLFHDPRMYHELFCTAMTKWMDELSSPSFRGKLDPLKEIFQEMFNIPRSTDELAPFLGFLDNKLREKEYLSQYRLLEWLQDLTCLGVIIPFLKAYFGRIIESLQQPDGGGGRSEHHAYVNTEPLSPNSPLSKCILMLDVVLAQIQVHPDKMVYAHSVLFTLTYDDVTLLMLDMLDLPKIWSSPHASDHHDSSNPCSLCRAHEVWFGIASQILQEYNLNLQRGVQGNEPTNAAISPSSSSAGSQSSWNTLKRLKGKLNALAAFRTTSMTTITEFTHQETVHLDESGHVQYSSTLVPAELPQTRTTRLKPINEESESVMSLGASGSPKTSHFQVGPQGIPGSPKTSHFQGGPQGIPGSPKTSHFQGGPQGIPGSPKTSHFQGGPQGIPGSPKTSHFQGGPQGIPGSPKTPRFTGGPPGIPGSPKTTRFPGALQEPVTTPISFPSAGGQRVLQRQMSTFDPSHVYKLFRRTIEMLQPGDTPTQATGSQQEHSQLHPQALYQIVDFLEVFVFNLNILELKEASKNDMLKDVHELFLILWDQLQSEHVFLAQKATPLLMKCVGFILPHVTQSVDMVKVKPFQVFWDKIDSTSFKSMEWLDRFHAAEKVMLLSQFVSDFDDLTFPQYAFLGYIFCGLIDLLTDPKPEVSVRARYCIEATKRSGLEGMVFCTTEIFNFVPSQQSRVLRCLSALHSAFPSMGLVTYDKVVKKLFIYQRLWGEHKSASASPVIPPRARVSKVNTGEHGGGFGSKQLREDQGVLSHSGPVLKEIFTLLMKLLADPSGDDYLCGNISTEDLIGKLELVVCHGPSFSIKVDDLRGSELLELVLSKMYKVLDRNTAFCQDITLIYFLLRLLVFIVLPNEGEFPDIKDQLDAARQSSPSIGLELLDEQLCQAWLKVYFMICYKYGGMIQSLENEDEANVLMCWVTTCVRIIINTIHSKPHVCVKGESPAHDVASLERSTVDSGPKDVRKGSVFADRIHGIAKPKPLPLFKQSSITSGFAASTDLGRSQKRHRTSEVVDKVNIDANIIRAKAITLLRRPNMAINKCSQCNIPKKTYSENIINLCVVAMGTFAHRFPKVVAPDLKEIVTGMARVIITGSYSWQDVKVANSKPGSAIPVAKQFLNCVLSQFGARNLFLHLFRWDLKDNPLLPAMVSSLLPCKDETTETGKTVPETMTQVTPIKLLLKDCLEGSNLHLASNDETVFQNLGEYVCMLKSLDAKKDLVSLLPQFEQLVKRLLKSANQVIINNWNLIVRIIVKFVQCCKEVREEQLRSKSQDQTSDDGCHVLLSSFGPTVTQFLELGLVYCPKVSLYSLVALSASWYDAFSFEQKTKEQESLLRLIGIHHLTQALKLDNLYQMNSRIALIQFASLAQGVSPGYLIDFTGQKVNIRELMLDNVYKTCLEAFAQFSVNLDCAVYLLCTIAVKEPVLQLLTAELLLKSSSVSSHSPMKTIRGMLYRIDKSLSETASRTTGSGGGVRSVSVPQVLSMLTWLILAAMRVQAIVDTVAVNDTSVTTFLGIQHTSTRILYLLDPSDQERFVKMIPTIVIEALMSLVINDNRQNAQAVFVFIQVWTVYLELVQDKVFFDVVSHLVQFWENIAKTVAQAENGGDTLHCFHKCLTTLKKANVTALSPLFHVIVKESVPLSQEVESNPQKSIDSLDDWFTKVLQELSKI